MKATYADIEALCDRFVGEVLEGALYASPRLRPRHSLVMTRLLRGISLPFEEAIGGPGGWWVLFGPELRLDEDYVVPDLAGWRRERLPSIPNAARLELAPDWVCEILSPSTERIDRGLKLRIYAREGVSHLWLLNPDARTLEVYRLQVGEWVVVAVHTGEMPIRAEPFAAIELDLAALWGETPC